MKKNDSVSKISMIAKVGLALAGAALTVASLQARDYSWEIVVDGLDSPKGIAAKFHNRVYYTEVPDPGVPGTEGGQNTVKLVRFRGNSNNIQSTTTISEGEPYPINLASEFFGDRIYWTCQTAGVILSYTPRNGKEFFLPADGLDAAEEDFLLDPTGITVDRFGDVLFTELPMPGTLGPNMVSVSDGTNIDLISNSEPAPTDITISFNGNAYWTCNTVGVIFKRSRAGVTSILLDGLNSPTGIAVDRRGQRLYFTEVPNPGVGTPFDTSDDDEDRLYNTVKEYDLKTGEISVVANDFPWPNDVSVNSRGDVFWTCTTAGVIARARAFGN